MAAATRGPVPKRSTERRRRNKDSKSETVKVIGKVPVPRADPKWHPIALEWYRSLSKSGQSRFFEPSDWQAARFVAHAMTKNLKSARFSAPLFQAIWTAMGELLTTEGARRRVRIEIERDLEDKTGTVSVLDDYREVFTGSS